MENLKRKIKENKAITLIALVITIVILIILASVAINMTLGNNGLFTRAKTAKEQYQNAQDYEETQIAKFSNDIDSYVGGERVSSEDLKKLQDALKYSGIAVSNMKFDEICEALKTKFTNPVNIYENGSFSKQMTCSKGTLTENSSNFTLLANYGGGYATLTSNNSIDFSNYKHLYMTYSLSSSRTDWLDYAEVSIGTEPELKDVVVQRTPGAGYGGYSVSNTTMMMDIPENTQGYLTIHINGSTSTLLTVNKIWVQ